LAYTRKAVHAWTGAHVCAWLANAHGGRFAQVVVPLGTDGRKLLQLSVRRLTELVQDSERLGRGGATPLPPPPAAVPEAATGQGSQAAGEVGWYIASQAKIGRALFAALRDEQRGRLFSD